MHLTKLARRLLRSSSVVLVGLTSLLLVSVGADASTYPYTATTTATPNSGLGAGSSTSVTFSITWGAVNDFPAAFKTAATSTDEYEIVLCPDTGVGGFVDSFPCYAVSDPIQNNGAFDPTLPVVGTNPLAGTGDTVGNVTDDVVAGKRLCTSGGDCAFAYSDFPVTVNLPTTLPTVNGNGRGRISVQSLKRYGDDGNVCIAGQQTGVGIDSDLAGDNPCGTVTNTDPVCQPFCYTYNGTPRFVAETTITF